MRAADALHPDWLVTGDALPGAFGLQTTRAGGVSAGPFASMNLRDGLGDAPQAVAENVARLRAAIGVDVVLLNQVHGTRVVRVGRWLVAGGWLLLGALHWTDIDFWEAVVPLGLVLLGARLARRAEGAVLAAAGHRDRPVVEWGNILALRKPLGLDGNVPSQQTYDEITAMIAGAEGVDVEVGYAAAAALAATDA